MSVIRLPQPEQMRGCHFAPLLELNNDTGEDLRFELLDPSGNTWATLLPLVRPGTWSKTRSTPLWLPRVKAVRMVRVSDGLELWRRVPWGDGGVVHVAHSSEVSESKLAKVLSAGSGAVP